MLRPVRVTAPAIELVSLAEIKAQTRIETAVTDDDTLLAALVQAATDHLDGWSGILGRCLISQVWRQDFHTWRDILRLPFPDVQSVVITYYDADNAEQTVSAAFYELLEDERGSFVCFRDGFTSPALYSDRSDPVKVAMTVGYGDDTDDVPQAIRHAAMMLAAHWYENREAIAEGNPMPVPMGVTALTDPYRRNRI